MKGNKIIEKLVITTIVTVLLSGVVTSGYVGDEETWVADSVCARFGYIQPSAVKGQWILTTQNGTRGVPPYPAQYAVCDINDGWITTYEEIFSMDNPDTNMLVHNSWGYCDNKYWNVEGSTNGKSMYCISATNWSDFQSMNYSEKRDEIMNPKAYTTSPVLYCLNETHMLLLFAERDIEYVWYPAYIPWDSVYGWGDTVLLEEGASSTRLTGVELLRMNKTHWRMYYVKEKLRELRYIESFDGGITWSDECDTNLDSYQKTQQVRVSFATYGYDCFYTFVDTSSERVYVSEDGISWSHYKYLHAGDSVHHGCLFSQDYLLSTYPSSDDPGPQYARFTSIPEMLSYPNKSTDPIPDDNSNISCGTTGIYLSTVVHGSQVYDVCFYLGDGTFIGKDILLEEGDTASVYLDGLIDDITYDWYTITRGATCDRWRPCESLNTTDQIQSDIWSFNIGEYQEPPVETNIIFEYSSNMTGQFNNWLSTCPDWVTVIIV